MRKDQILQTAISRNIKKTQIGDKCDSAFSLVHRCIGTVSSLRLTEREKREKLLCIFQGFWRGGSRHIDGCKREHLKKIVELVFGIDSGQTRNLHKEISQYTVQELYLYYCYIERFAGVDTYFSELLWNYSTEEQKILAERAAARVQKEKQEQEERERAQEEAERRRLEGMSREEKWRYDIFEKQQDISYFEKLADTEAYSVEDHVKIAGFLMDYWKMTGRWEVKKKSKKQAAKIDKVKGILGQDVKG